MFNQMFYFARNRLWWRLAALFLLIVGNGVFFFLTRNLYEENVIFILGVVFASFAFLGTFVMSIIVSTSSFEMLDKDQKNYLMKLTPIPTWKKYLGALIPSVLFDGVTFTISIFGIVMIATSTSDVTMGEYTPMIALGMVTLAAYYALLISAGIFYNGITKTILSNVPLRRLLGAIITIVALFVLSWVNIALAPFGELENFGPLFNVSIHDPTALHSILMILLVCVQSAVLLFTGSHLQDNKN